VQCTQSFGEREAGIRAVGDSARYECSCSCKLQELQRSSGLPERQSDGRSLATKA